MTVKGNSRLYFNVRSANTTETDLYKRLIPYRADHYVRLLGYRAEYVAGTVTFSTTATWEADCILATVPNEWGDWTLNQPSVDGLLTPPDGVLIDSWRFSGGIGRISTNGGYVVPKMARSEPVICDLAVPGVFIATRRTAGLNQRFGIMGYIDYEWVRGNPGEMAAVNMHWSAQGEPVQ